MARLELRYDLRSPESAEVSVAERYSAALDQIVWAEERGFRAVTLSEHHGTPDGFLPSPLIFGAAVAARTTRIKIRIAALIAPLHDPLRLAEDIAVLDQLSSGRVEVVIANGYVESEFAMFGKDIKDRVNDVTETVATLKAAWTGEPFEFRGRTVQVTPRPYREPRPNIFLGGASRGAARRAARIADLFFPSLPEHWDFYREAMVEAGHADFGPFPPLAPRFVFFDEDEAAGWSKVEQYVAIERNSYGEWAEQANLKTGVEKVSELSGVRDDPNYQVLSIANGRALVESLGDHGTIAMHPMMGGIPPALAWENLERFWTDIVNK